jgi:hypothetical protein
VKPDFAVDLLTASSRIDARLAARAIEHLLAFAKQAESTAWPAVGRLREASLDHLRRRISVHPGGTASPGGNTAAPADRYPDTEHFLQSRQRQLLARAIDQGPCREPAQCD